MSSDRHINPKIITAILSRDQTSTSYKYALLRAVVQCIANHHSHKKRGSSGWVKFPLGILIYYWLLYYFPIVGNRTFIPQMNGESISPDGKQMAIRPAIKRLTDHYNMLEGDAFSQFKLDLDLGSYPDKLKDDFLEAAKKVRGTIISMPMKHLGFSQFGEHYSLIRKAESGRLTKVSLYNLIMGAGYFEIREELYQVLLELGPIIVGEESILSSWATYTERAADRISEAPDLDQKAILNLLTQSHHDIRDTQEIRRLVLNNEGLQRCVWSGNKLTENNMHVDHVIPYSIWQNNELWNLLPATNSINTNKSDKIPTPDLINRSSERILETWSIYKENFGDRFLKEAFNGLGYNANEELYKALESLIFKSEYLIEKRGMPAFEG